MFISVSYVYIHFELCIVALRQRFFQAMSDKQMDVKLGDFMLNYNDLAMHRNICNDIGMHKKRSEEHLETSLDFRDNNTIVHPVRTTSVIL